MIHAVFLACNEFDFESFKDPDKFLDTFSDFQEVTLKDEKQLTLLLDLIGIHGYKWLELNGMIFSRYCNISDCMLPELSKNQLDEFISIG